MRGILAWFGDADHGIGITPAHAGNTLMLSRSTLNLRDHPRACGEYLF